MVLVDMSGWHYIGRVSEGIDQYLGAVDVRSSPWFDLTARSAEMGRAV